MLIFIFIMILLKSSWVVTQDAPKPPHYSWANGLIHIHLMNMTTELILDTTYKLKHAEKIKDEHSHSITYELGFIAAGIQERFQRMLKMYRKYADIRDFEKQKYPLREVTNAFHILPNNPEFLNIAEGDYNEILLEKSLFHNIVLQHEKSPSTKFDIFSELEKRMTKGVKWESNL